MVTYVQLQTFLWLARLGSASAVADHLYLTQPGVSARLAQLQDLLQVQLFTRTKEGLRLTSDGHRLKRHAEQIEARFNMLQSDMVPRHAQARVFRVGVVETIAKTWLADFLIAVGNQRPEIHLDLVVDTTDNLRNELLHRGIDLAVLMGPLSNSEVTNWPVPNTRMRWYRRVGWSDERVATAPIITFSTTTKPFKQMWARVLRGEENRRFIPTASLSAGFELVARGVGVGALPEVYSETVLAANDLERFEGGPLPDPPSFTVSYLSEPLNEALDQFAEIGIAVAAEFNRDAPK